MVTVLIELTLERYQELLRSERELIALESAGVDNWEGYSYVNWEYVEDDRGNPTTFDD